MSAHPPFDSAIQHLIVPRSRDLGDGFTVRRSLPAAERQMVGPFVFFDQMGPTLLQPGKGLDVRPHPHIGLSTVTYLFDGEILHRDSLGTVRAIQPGAVNWMTAGRGIVHSERTPPELRAGGAGLFGIQAWVALPQAHEECEPAFEHYPASALPAVEGDGVTARVIAGTFQGARSPVRFVHPVFYVDVQLAAGARIDLAAEFEERAAYIVSGAVTVRPGDTVCESGTLATFAAGRPVELRAGAEPARVMLLGGEPMDGPRHVYWNFVSSSRERIQAAKADWRAGRFAAVPGETEFIPLPEDAPPVRYP